MSQDKSAGALTAVGQERISPLLDVCERLRQELLVLVSRHSPHGTPALGPVLLFLEDPKEGVLRPATRVEWDDLRLGHILGHILATSLALLDAVRNGLTNDSESARAFLRSYNQHSQSLINPAELRQRVVAAFAHVVKILEGGAATRIDDPLPAPNEFHRDLELLEDDLRPILEALHTLPRSVALVLGVPPESNRIPPNEIVRNLANLRAISLARARAWLDLVSTLHETDLDEYAKGLVSASQALVSPPAHLDPGSARALLDHVAQQIDPSTTGFREAIRLFQWGPQEIGSSCAYLVLQYLNARENCRTREPYDVALGSVIYRPGRGRAVHRYPAELIEASPLYRVTHRLEQLFYGAKEPGTRETAIQNIIFIPIRYFTGQVVGQLVLIMPPGLDADMQSIVEVSRSYLREITSAAAGELMSLVHHSLPPASRRPGLDDVLTAVAGSLVSMVSVTSQVVLRRYPGEYRVLHAVTRGEDPQPQDLVTAFLNESSAELNRLAGGAVEIPDKLMAQFSLEAFLAAGTAAISPRRRPLRPLTLCTSLLLPALDGLLDVSPSERTFVVTGDEDGAAKGVFAELQDLLQSRRATDSYLILRLGNAGSRDEAVFILRFWEPAAAVRRLATGVLHAAWSALESCRELVSALEDRFDNRALGITSHILLSPLYRAAAEASLLPESAGRSDLVTSIGRLTRLASFAIHAANPNATSGYHAEYKYVPLCDISGLLSPVCGEVVNVALASGRYSWLTERMVTLESPIVDEGDEEYDMKCCEAQIDTVVQALLRNAFEHMGEPVQLKCCVSIGRGGMGTPRTVFFEVANQTRHADEALEKLVQRLSTEFDSAELGIVSLHLACKACSYSAPSWRVSESGAIIGRAQIGTLVLRGREDGDER